MGGIADPDSDCRLYNIGICGIDVIKAQIMKKHRKIERSTMIRFDQE